MIRALIALRAQFSFEMINNDSGDAVDAIGSRAFWVKAGLALPKSPAKDLAALFFGPTVGYRLRFHRGG
jgi:hypothetical protein